MVVKKSVKKVKLTIKPTKTPKGCLFPEIVELDKIIGNTGKIHGERMVTTPAKKAKNIKICIGIR